MPKFRLRRFLPFVAMAGAWSGGVLWGQEDIRPQFHGFATQGFVYTGDGNNNYLGMNTSSGSAAWNEAALNVNAQVTDKLRVGAQFHFTRLGQFGDANVGLDWALGDYRVNQWFGLRAGKVKIRWGLYNDTQDADSGYLWSLLPEPMYAVDFRATNLSQLGAEAYGKVRLGSGRGELGYSMYYGDYFYAANDGYMETFREDGLNFSKQPTGRTPGFDLRWKTPVSGLMMGGSVMVYDAEGKLANGVFREPLTYWPAYYVHYEKRKIFLSGQYMTLVQHTDISIDGETSSSVSDTRAWFAMAGYRLSDKLQVGVYHTRNIVASEPDKSDPANRFRDWTVSSRYDINSFSYLKVEGHFIDGNGLGFYSFNNPDGLKPKTKVLVVKIGFTF